MGKQKTEDTIDWETFRSNLEETWEDLKSVDLDDVREDISDLSQKIHNKTEQSRRKVKKQVQALAEKFNYSFE